METKKNRLLKILIYRMRLEEFNFIRRLEKENERKILAEYRKIIKSTERIDPINEDVLNDFIVAIIIFEGLYKRKAIKLIELFFKRLDLDGPGLLKYFDKFIIKRRNLIKEFNKYRKTLN